MRQIKIYIGNNTISAVPNKEQRNPFGSKVQTPKIFDSMIENCRDKCKVMIISYNNQGVMNQDGIESLSEKYNLQLFTEKLKYKKYKSNKQSKDDELYEILWILKNK